MDGAAAGGEIRVGIVGAGANTCAQHIPKLQTLPGVRIVSVCNRRRESTDHVAATFGIPNVYRSWQELVAADDTDAIVIGTWPYLHAPVTLAALEADKHVMCEARMARNLAEARCMLAAAEARPECVCQVVPAPFTLHLDVTIRRLIASGYLGSLLTVEVRSDAGAFLDRDGALTWRRDERLSGRNILAMGIWYETLMRWVGEATKVAATGRTFVPQRPDPVTGEPRDVRIPDCLGLVAELRNGAQAYLRFSACRGLVPENGATLCGSEGTLRIANGVLTGGRRGDDALTEIAVAPGEAAGWRVEEEFINAIRGVETIRLTDFATGVRYMAFTEAVGISLEAGGCMVAVPD